MITIGLTGSIGMGKSTAGKMLKEMGIPVHDADAAVHTLIGPGGAAVKAVSDAFPGVLGDDGGIDRKKLGAIVFDDTEAKKRLEAILHPMVQQETARWIAAAKERGEKMVVLDIPLLFETKADEWLDVTICVSAPAEVQRARVLARPGMTPERLEAVLATQMPDADKRARADFVVDSGTSLEKTRSDLEQVVAKLKTVKKENGAHFKPR